MRPFYLLSLAFASACIMPPAGGNSGPAYGGGGGGGYSGGSTSSDPMPASQNASMSSSSSSPAPAGPVSVTIRSACSKDVKVFFGDKPKFGSGTYSSIESNSVQSHSFRPGEMMWIVDESENGLGSTSVGPGTRELEVSSSCTSINAR